LLVDSLEILEDLVDRAFGPVEAFCRIRNLDDLFSRLGVRIEEPLEETTIEDPVARRLFLPMTDLYLSSRKSGCILVSFPLPH
jgi:hypothetical protein